MRLYLLLMSLLILSGCQEGSNGTKQDVDRLNKIAVLIERGQTAEAILPLQKYVKTYPRDDLALTILGNTFSELERYEEAQIAYQSAIEVNPIQVLALRGIGDLYRARKESDAAMMWYQRAIAVDSTYSAPYSRMMEIALHQHDDKNALVYAQKAYDTNLDSMAIAAANLALAYHFNDDFENRDKYKEMAGKLGYRMSAMEDVFSGKVKYRD